MVSTHLWRVIRTASLVGAALGLPLAASAAEPVRRNVVLIMADDLNNDLGCYGFAAVQSPQLDRLARRSVRFDRAYCQYPVCNPSRASLLSGRRPESTGILDNVTPARSKLPDAIFLPQYFRQQGYRTIKVGKISHTGDAFEDGPSWEIDVRETREAKNPPPEQILRELPGQGIVLNADDAKTWDGFVARRGVELLDEAVAGERPFLLAIGFRRPHTPYIAPRNYFALYPPEQITFLDEPAGHLDKIPPLALTYRQGAKRLDAATRPLATSAYRASLSFIDAQIALILDALDRHDLWQNTVVVFASDHGYHLGEHGGLWHKMTLFEKAARVPLLVAAPGVDGGKASTGLVELVDLYPTLVELAGLPAAPDLEGQSFAPLLAQPDRAWKQGAFTVV
ncbi:MAG: sulfatase, partial [Planctomycetaceae bacterium]|nr:sulfatase [Planctomycetaceae bacterium]